MNVIKPSLAISRVNVELKTNVLETVRVSVTVSESSLDGLCKRAKFQVMFRLDQADHFLVS
jgi:hypothetical protein